MGSRERRIPNIEACHNRVTIMTGVSGSGKDFLIREAKRQEILPEEVRVLATGEELFYLLKDTYPWITSRDDLKTLPPEALEPALETIADHVLKVQPALLNTHTVVRQGTGGHLYPNFDRKLKSQDYLFVWTEPDQIADWRKNDTSRKRIHESVDDISFYQDFSLGVASLIAQKIGAGFTTVWNREDNVSETLDKIGDITRKLTT